MAGSCATDSDAVDRFCRPSLLGCLGRKSRQPSKLGSTVSWLCPFPGPFTCRRCFRVDLLRALELDFFLVALRRSATHFGFRPVSSMHRTARHRRRGTFIPLHSQASPPGCVAIHPHVQCISVFRFSLSGCTVRVEVALESTGCKRSYLDCGEVLAGSAGMISDLAGKLGSGGWWSGGPFLGDSREHGPEGVPPTHGYGADSCITLFLRSPLVQGMLQVRRRWRRAR